MLNDLVSKLAALVLMFLSAPVFLLISILVIADSGLPVIFKQIRRGKNGRPFMVYKFRTMKEDAVTNAGSFLRAYGMDEIPQLLNILKGEMAFVGPRPLTEEDIERLKWNEPHCKGRWSVKPGITGPAQLESICDASLSMEHDLQYVGRKTVGHDISILLKTVRIAVIGKRTK